MVSNPLSHVRLFCLVFFSSALTQTVLTHTVGSNRVQRSLALEALNCWTAYCIARSFWEKLLRFGGNKTFAEKTFSGLFTGIAAKRCHAPNFAEKIFEKSCKPRKFSPSKVSRYTVSRPRFCVPYVRMAYRPQNSFSGYDNDMVAEHDVENHDTSTLLAFYGCTHFC